MKLKKYIHTARYLRPVQIYGRILHRFTRVSPDLSAAPALRPVQGKWIQPPDRHICMLGPDEVCFLNYRKTISSPQDWTSGAPEKLWLLNLHYFDDFVAADAASRKEWHIALIDRWIRENPPAEGIGWKDAYALSLRIVNWIKWSLNGNRLSDTALHSLAVQARYLTKTTEWYLLGNHVLANAKALIFAGCFFDGKESDAWLKQGLDMWNKEIQEEILADGGHFERSPMYHSIILEDLLDLVNLVRAYKLSSNVANADQKWEAIINPMRIWLKAMCHPDGRISFFNDAAWGIALEPEDLERYATVLNFPSVSMPAGKLIHLKDSGYIRLTFGDTVAILDVAKIGPDYIPGHSHADTLSFELSVYGQRVFVNSGTSTYKIFPDRQIQRGTSSHNTVVVDGKDSSEVWGSFRVARRAYPKNLSIEESPDTIKITCEHDGYMRLPEKVVHSRTWTLTSQELVIEDTINSDKESSARYHLYPEVNAKQTDKQTHLALTNGETLRWTVDTGDLQLEDTSFYPEFGKSVANQCLSVALKDGKSRCRLSW